jgi:hypothetical protein
MSTDLHPLVWAYLATGLRVRAAEIELLFVGESGGGRACAQNNYARACVDHVIAEDNLLADKTVPQIKIDEVRELLSEPHRVCRRLQLLIRMEHDQQDDEQVFR